jgi:MoaA/NifB/PqqE/SkfB family radical SAM enzyme
MQHKKPMTEFEEVIVELSHNCNLSCSMCGFGKAVNPYSKSKFLTFEGYKNILRKIGDKTKTIRLNGRGESAIHPDFVEILNYTKEQYPHVKINLFSNFSFENKRILGSLINNSVQLFISMDSSEAKELEAIRKGAKFQLIEENIKRLSEIPNRPFIIFTIQEANIHRIYDMANFSYKHNCHILYNTVRRDEGIQTFVDLVNEKKQIILKQLQKVTGLYSSSALQCLFPDQLAGIQLKVANPTQTHGAMQNCPALNKELCIFYDGTATPCNMFNPYVYGNIFKQSLNEIWNSQRRLDFINSHKKHYYCQNCANLGI